MRSYIPLAMLTLLMAGEGHAEGKDGPQKQHDEDLAVDKIEQAAVELSKKSPNGNASSIAGNVLSDISAYRSYGRGLSINKGATTDIITDTENLSKTIKYNWKPDTAIFRCYSDYEICKTVGYAWTTCGPALWICAVETIAPQLK